MAYKVRINGESYTVTVGPNGESVYDPPLPQSRVERDRENIQDIVRTGKCPGLQTDTGFLGGRGTLLDQMEGDSAYVDRIVHNARRQGYEPGASDVYISQLARFPGDRQAFLRAGEGKKEIERRCRERGLACQGSVNVKGKDYVESEPVKLSKKNQDQMMRYYRKHEGVSKADMSDSELRQHVIKKHGRQTDE